jgi:hypothetical protein
LIDAAAKLEAGMLSALSRDEPLDACALQFILWRYRTGQNSDLGLAVGRGLAVALEGHAADTSIVGLAAWLSLFVDVAGLSDDDRIVPAIDALVARLRAAWRAPSLGDSAPAVAACLHAARIPAFSGVAADAIDALEQMIGRVYRPGAGVGGGAPQVHAASALLAGFGLSARLPYSMLAEELIQAARRGEVTDFAAACEAARVLCRLAVLHANPEYRAAAVIAPDARYRDDAAGLLAQHAAEAERRGAAAGIYGLALLELESPDSQAP